MIENGIFKIWINEDGRRIVYSRGKGVASAEDVQGLIDAIMELSAQWQDEKGFAYMAFIENLEQVEPMASEKYVLLHETMSKSHCKCIAYIEGNSYEVSVQASKHKKRSESPETVNKYFAIEEEGLHWFEEFGF